VTKALGEPSWMSGIEAVLFDMDGTLVDSEHLTARAIDSVLAPYGSQPEVGESWSRGRTWRSIADALRARVPGLRDAPVESLLQEHFHRALVETAPPAIPGARGAVRAASRRGPTALVSSSDRASVLHVLERFGLTEQLAERVTAEDCDRSKPDPQCFQIAAARLGVECVRCVVFEDSVAGLTAARAAGMRTVALGSQHAGSTLADLVIADFEALPIGFFDVEGML
jgi:mannitol-1-/sugar-/sorbitol-6-phosphatase